MPRQVEVGVPIQLEGVRYYSISDVQRSLGIARQTLWRWRRDAKIPVGRRYRDRQILYTDREVEQIREYANRIEPALTIKSRRSA